MSSGAAKSKHEEIKPPFKEQENKLNAENERQLKMVRRHLLTDPHYVTDFSPDFRPDLLQGMRLIGVPQKFGMPRIRVYFDDIDLRGFRNDVEIRNAFERKSMSEQFQYKQVIKVGANEVTEDGVFERVEYAAKHDSPVPNLDLVKNGMSKYLRDVFEVTDLSKVKLLPFILIASQRWRIEYHPDGDKRTCIEHAHDVARGQNIFNFTWDLFQIEFELKHGKRAVLQPEKQRLLDMFNFLSPGTESKPTPGFNALADGPFLDDRRLRKKVQEQLQAGQFRVLKLP